jgi:phage tail-like protein
MRRNDWLLAQLPVGMTEDDFLARFVSIFQTIGDSLMHHADTMGHLTDVAVAPDPMVRALGSWLGLDWVDPSLPDRLQRLIVAEYASSMVWRGTKVGLQRVLQAVTGAPVAIADSGGVYAEGEAPDSAPHVVIHATASQWATDTDLERIVRSELPATVTFELHIERRPPIGHAA